VDLGLGEPALWDAEGKPIVAITPKNDEVKPGKLPPLNKPKGAARPKGK
jgi:hypothetical protein